MSEIPKNEEDEEMDEAEGEDEFESQGAESSGPADRNAQATQQVASTSVLGRDQWNAIKQITEKSYEIRIEDDHDPSKVFHRKVNKRVLPDYYDVIKEPVALSTMKAKILHRSYTNFEEYVRDAALISHNAQTYNRPEAGAYQDALILKEFFQAEFKRLVEQGIITAQTAEYPDLGELPPVEDLPPPAETEDVDEEEDDEEEEDEEDEEESEDGGVKRRRRRGPRPSLSAHKKESASKASDGKPEESKRRRGRPPKVDTPLEARIKNILKGIRRLKSPQGHTMALSFERLPDKAELPDYYIEIKEPMSIEQIKRKAKRKKYQSVDHFLRDVDLMFNNCKSYNMDDSQVYADAVALQDAAHRLAAEEKAKPDQEYALEEGRLPLPNGTVHNGELWRIGDWVHLQNPNDVTKPIVAQIYRIWQDSSGDKWINACWYYRPEQTIHQFEKHFFPQEVMKTGHYRDHRIDEIVDRCFVMFVTRFGRGRPRGLDPTKDVYICESRYNEDKHRMNKIKTWASCLPDEVRDKDYEMDLFDHIRKIRKVPSPLLHLLTDDSTESNAKPRWGVENAPPIVGAIYKGPRDEIQSPPPEPTPSPSPQPVLQPSKANVPMTHSSQTPNPIKDVSRPPIQPSATKTGAPLNYPSTRPTQFQQPSPSAPPNVSRPYTQQQPVSRGNYPSDQYPSMQNRYNLAQRGQLPEPAQPRSDEVFKLSEAANLAIPPDVRSRFQQDEHGHVLFFTTPPVNTLEPVKPGSAVGHSAKYLAAKLRSQMAVRTKRDAASMEGLANDHNGVAHPRKKATIDTTEKEVSAQIQTLQEDALGVLASQLQNGTDRLYQDLYGLHWEEGKRYEMEKLKAGQQAAKAEKDARKARRNGSLDSAEMLSSYPMTFKDDINPRY